MEGVELEEQQGDFPSRSRSHQIAPVPLDFSSPRLGGICFPDVPRAHEIHVLADPHAHEIHVPVDPPLLLQHLRCDAVDSRLRLILQAAHGFRQQHGNRKASQYRAEGVAGQLREQRPDLE